VAPLPERFQVSKRVLRLDRLMTYVIMIGGVGVVAAEERRSEGFVGGVQNVGRHLSPSGAWWRWPHQWHQQQQWVALQA
jgi:hypothetical protein